jgi:hypothetical protein
MWTRPLGEMLTEVAGALLEIGSHQQIARATDMELRLPIEVKLRRRSGDPLFCADVPAWRWRTDWDLPIGELRLRLEEARLEIAE